MRGQQGYRKDIDGLRAVAVLAVLAFHAHIPFFPGGFVGVDVFFVISGFLISRIILNEFEAKSFSMLRFWERRIRRLFPAALVVVLSTLVAGWWLLLPQDFRSLGQSTFAQAVFSSNVYFWKVSGYFDQATELKPLVHTWSLSLEEQFYLFFPLLLYGVKRWVPGSMARIFLGIWVASFLTNLWSVSRYPEFAFFLLPARAWELLTGALVVVFPLKRDLRHAGYASTVAGAALLILLFSIVWIRPSMAFPGWVALMPCLATAILIWIHARHETWVSKLLSWKPMVFVGLISYSLYLWHWPLLSYLHYWVPKPGNTLQLIACGVAFLLAVLSWRFVEQPFRTKSCLRTRRAIFAWGAGAVVVVAGMGWGMHSSDGFRGRFQESTLLINDARERPSGMQGALRQHDWRGTPKTLHQASEGSPTLYLWGDSHLESVLHTMQSLGATYDLHVVGLTRPGAFHLDKKNLRQRAQKIALAKAYADFLSREPSAHVLLFFHWRSLNDPEELALFKEVLTPLTSAGARLYLLTSPPIYEIDLPRFAVLSAYAGIDMQLELFPEALDAQGKQSEDFFSSLQPLSFEQIDLFPLFVREDGRSLYLEASKLFYRDGDHLSVPGGDRLKPLLEPLFQSLKTSAEN